MGKWWALLFAVVMAACFLLFIISPFIGWWLPEGVTTHSGDVDFLFYVILYITGFFFVLTEVLLIGFIWRFGGGKEKTEAPPEEGSEPSFSQKMMAPVKKLIPDEQRLEMAWTIVPAAILLYIAFAQINTWAQIKYQSRMPKQQEGQALLQVAVSARQFEWRMRYPSPTRYRSWKLNPELAKDFKNNPHLDDVHVPNELHVWTNEAAESEEEYPAFLVHLSTIDVQHNLNIPHFRIKQDALPGKIIPVWFRPTKANTLKVEKHGKWFDGIVWNNDNPEFKLDKKGRPIPNKSRVWQIACAELCGRWHYHMIGKVYVHPSEEDFLEWLEKAYEDQHGQVAKK